MFLFIHGQVHLIRKLKQKPKESTVFVISKTKTMTTTKPNHCQKKKKNLWRMWFAGFLLLVAAKKFPNVPKFFFFSLNSYITGELLTSEQRAGSQKTQILHWL